jgi:O-antigen/teichoic acid export membrane protein
LRDLTDHARVTAPASLISNSGWNIAAFACGLASNVITIPFVVHAIGLAAFGQAGLVIAMCAPLMLVGTIIGQALVCEASSRLGARDFEGAQRATDAALRLCLVAAAAGWLAVISLGPALTNFLIATESTAHPLGLAFLICGSGFFGRQLVLVLQSTCVARQDFRRVAHVASFSAAADIGATLLITAAFPTTEGYLASIATGVALSLAAWLWIMRLNVHMPAILGAERRAELRALLRFGKWQGLAQLAATFAGQIDRYALGALAPVAAVGQYNVAHRLQEAAYIGVVKGSEVLLPHFGRLCSRSAQQRRQHFQTASWIVGTFGAAVLAPIVPLSEAVLTLWIGSEGAEGSAVLLRTLLLGGLIGIGSDVFGYYGMGSGRVAPVAVISVMYSVLTVIFTVLLIGGFGPDAAGAGTLVASVFRQGAVLFVIRRHFFPDLTTGSLMVSTVLPLAIGVLIAFTGHALQVGNVQSWAHLIALYATLAGLILSAIVLASAVTRSGREIVLRIYAALGHRTRAFERTPR